MESIKQISENTIYNILTDTKHSKDRDERNNSLHNLIFGLFFFEPSTRTCLSFESAIHRLGGKIIKYNVDCSSQRKGETLEDTIRMMDNYVDVIIIRHPEKNVISRLKKITSKPIINAGDGAGEHPTQALLDVFTIFDSCCKTPETIAFTGDIKYSRTIHSLVYLISKIHPTIIFYFVCDPRLEPSGIFLDFLDNMPQSYYIHQQLEPIIAHIDVLYATRLQKERHSDHYVKNIMISKHTIRNSKPSLVVMHPLPRNDELSTDLDDDPRSKYFEQAKNGVFARMAVLKFIYNTYLQHISIDTSDDTSVDTSVDHSVDTSIEHSVDCYSGTEAKTKKAKYINIY